MKVLDIKKMFFEANVWEYEDIISSLQSDTRSSVKKFLKSNSKKYGDYLNKKRRMEDMGSFDLSYGNLVVGVDEAGRGPLFGPVFAAACVISPCKELYEVYDSKKLSESKREELFGIIKERAVAYGVGSESAKYIDEYGIISATSSAMKKALECVDKSLTDSGMELDNVIVDYITFDIGGRDYVPVKKGDQKSFSVACASILAKVSRDRFIIEIAKNYPGYGLEKHKGYGSAAHIEAIVECGPSDRHRKTFLTGILG